MKSQPSVGFKTLSYGGIQSRPNALNQNSMRTLDFPTYSRGNRIVMQASKSSDNEPEEVVEKEEIPEHVIEDPLIKELA